MDLQLRPSQKAALALWFCAARRLDPESCPCEDPEGITLLTSAYNKIAGDARSVDDAQVKSNEAMGPYLRKAAARLVELLPSDASVQASDRVREAGTLLYTIAQDATNSDDGGCGLIEFASVIEKRVRQLYKAEGFLLSISEKDPIIRYVITVAEDKLEVERLEPFCIGGKTEIGRLPRTVYLIVQATALHSRDMWHIAYTIYHELVCHAFQGAFATKRLPDPHPNCHWSEAWMDTLAFDLVMEWKEEAPKEWLPLRGDHATAELWRIHDHRYVKSRLEKAEEKRRSRTRDAFRHLVKALRAYEIAVSDEEASDITRRFSLSANSHCEADCKRLNALVAQLRHLLLDVSRPAAAVAAARACLAFTADHDLGKLEQTIKSEFLGGSIS